MRPLGFSTGALARGDFRTALSMVAGHGTSAVELSALRTVELGSLLDAVDSLRLDDFQHISVHAPSKFEAADESWIVETLRRIAADRWPVVVHPDTIHSAQHWRAFGSRLLIENMDKRKPIGRSAAELEMIFAELPEAGLCLDLAHARQFDPTMVEAYRILNIHGSRLRQVHLSDVSSASKHTWLSYGAIHDFQEVAMLVPPSVPVILESPVSAQGIAAELRRAREALPSPALVRL
ncbi:MAG TPA: TIM barrel protein [Longimicrobium sp.]|jgi:hypothetical protein